MGRRRSQIGNELTILDVLRQVSQGEHLQLLVALSKRPSSVRELAEIAVLNPESTRRQLRTLESVALVTRVPKTSPLVFCLADDVTIRAGDDSVTLSVQRPNGERLELTRRT